MHRSRRPLLSRDAPHGKIVSAGDYQETTAAHLGAKWGHAKRLINSPTRNDQPFTIYELLSASTLSFIQFCPRQARHTIKTARIYLVVVND